MGGLNLHRRAFCVAARQVWRAPFPVRLNVRKRTRRFHRVASGKCGLWCVGPLVRGADPSRRALRALLRMTLWMWLASCVLTTRQRHPEEPASAGVSKDRPLPSRKHPRKKKRRHLHAAVFQNQIPSPPRWTAAMPVRETSTSPRGFMIVMNCSTLEVRPVISKVK